MVLKQFEPKKIYIRVEAQPITTSGIYHNSDLGLISLSSDGSNWITIADKNLGATQVYNDGDTLSEANAGKYYQRGNNYGFPRTGSVTTSSTRVNADTYGPGNYYNNSTFRTVNESWDSSNNFNLWGGTTGTNEAMQGPCDTGFHIPLSTEWDTIVTMMTGWGKNTTANWKSLLYFPMAGYRNYYDASLVRQNSYGYYWSNSIYSGTYISAMSFDGSPRFTGQFRSSGNSIRPFKNEAVQPDDTWTVLYQ